MKKIIVVTKCINLSSSHPRIAQFSFKGHYMGHKVECLQIIDECQRWEKNEEYVIYLGVLTIQKKCLQGQALKVKKLSEFLMES